jgi:hypothetical protein
MRRSRISLANWVADANARLSMSLFSTRHDATA